MEPTLEEWDRLIGVWITNVPYLLTENRTPPGKERWNRLRRIYLIHSSMKQGNMFDAVHVALYGDEQRKKKAKPSGFLIDPKRCSQVSQFFAYMIWPFAKTNVSVKDTYGDAHYYVYIEGHKFPYLPERVFHRYHGIHPKIVSGIRRTYQTLVLPAPKVEARKPKYDAAPLYSFFWYLTNIVGKYPNVCTPVGRVRESRLTLDDLVTSISLIVYIYDEDWSDIKILGSEYLNMARICLHLPSVRFLFIFLGLQTEYKRSGHANLMILDKKTRKAYHFEPHGAFDVKSEKVTVYAVRAIDPSGKWEYVDSSSWCPRVAFQSLEETVSEYGLCMPWTLWFMEVLLNNPDVSMSDIHRMAQSAIVENDRSYQSFIRRYVRSMEEFGDVMRQRFGLTYRTPEKEGKYVIPEAEADRLRTYAAEVRERYLKELGVAPTWGDVVWRAVLGQ